MKEITLFLFAAIVAFPWVASTLTDLDLTRLVTQAGRLHEYIVAALFDWLGTYEQLSTLIGPFLDHTSLHHRQIAVAMGFV